MVLILVFLVAFIVFANWSVISWISYRSDAGKSNKLIMTTYLLCVFLLVASSIVSIHLYNKHENNVVVSNIPIQEIYKGNSNDGEFFVKTDDNEFYKINSNNVYKGDSNYIIRYHQLSSNQILWWTQEERDKYIIVLTDTSNIPSFPELSSK